MEIFERLKLKLKEHGAQCRMISVEHVPELHSEIDELYKNSLIDGELYKNQIENYFDYSIPIKYPSVKSIIIIATPSALINVIFNINGSLLRSKIPPMYTDKIIINDKIKKITNQLFDANGYKTIPVILPKKLIAAHSGLAKFGKNNICYVSGMGSHIRITLFGSDLPCNYDSWQDLQMLDRCNNCKACINHCPTGAISTELFIIKAERCLTYFNEQIKSFPEWLDTRWHNSIIGCMRCQSICPENRKNTTVPEKEVEFSKSETDLILNNKSFKKLPESLQSKLKNLCMDRYYQQISRNLNVLVENKLN